jgi:metallo-beta-lactamase family protein
MENQSKVNIQFLGGAGTVTGSKTLVEFNGKRILIDCGLFQGLKQLRELNWKALELDPKTIDAIILTHGHLDHCGYIPALVKSGFKGAIHCTEPTLELTEIILKDSAKIQEEDAERASRHSYGKRKHCLPLYTIEDAEKAIEFLVPHNYNEWVVINSEFKFQLINAGHILGSAMVELKVNGEKFVFTGDIGRKDPMLLYPPKKIKEVDYLIIESTYGDRIHNVNDPKNALLEVIKETYNRGGILMVPSFAVERTQELIYLIHLLKEEESIPNIPVYLDSPMGVKSTLVFEKYPKYQDLSKFITDNMYSDIKFVSSYEESKTVVADKKPKIILAGSGMLEGGRMLHYIGNHGKNQNNTILFVGFQAEGTRGRDLVQGSKRIKIFGEYYDVQCEIKSISSMSAHADRSEMLDWMKNIKTPPKKVFLNHGEPHQTNAFRVLIETELNWDVHIPKLDERIEL